MILVRGVFIAVSAIASFMIVNAMSKNLAAARTAALVTLVMSQLIHVFECKSEHKSLFELPVLSNKYLILAVLSSVLMLLGIILPPIPFGSLRNHGPGAERMAYCRGNKPVGADTGWRFWREKTRFAAGA